MCRVALENDLAIMRALYLMLIAGGHDQKAVEIMALRINETQAVLDIWFGEDPQPVCESPHPAHTA